MATISENLQSLINSKADMKSAIIEKGVTPTGGLETYAEAIKKITGDELDAKCEVTFNDDVVALKVEMSDEDITSDVVSSGNVLVPKITGDLNIKVSEYKSITYIINNVDLTNTINKIPVSYKYNTSLNCDYGYEFDTVVVMMGGTNVTDSVFNVVSTKNDIGDIIIEEVTGDITISVQCKLKSYIIDNNNQHTSSSNDITRITHGQTYSSTITADEHYELTSVKVVMNNEIIINESWDELDCVHTFDINIPQVIEDVVITTEARQVIVITTVLTDVSSSNSQTKYRYGETFQTTLSTPKYYDFTDIQFNASGVEGDSVLDEDTRIRTKEITLQNLQNDVTLYATAERVQYTIEYNLTSTTSDNSRYSILEGEKYTSTFTPIQYFEFNTVNILHNGQNAIDNFNENTGKLVIDEVIGNISIEIISTNIVCTITRIFDSEITSNNNASTVLMGQPYSELLQLNSDSFDYISTTVTMGGESINYHNMSNGEINIPIVLGDIIIKGENLIDTETQHNTLDHYTFEEINELPNGSNVDIILTSPRKDHGYTFGYNGSNVVNIGNGYRNLIYMQHKVAEISSDNQYAMTLSKTQNTKMEDVYGSVSRTFTVSGSLYNSNLTQLTSNIGGYDLYGLSANLTVGYNTTRTGTVTVNFNGKQLPRTIYVKMYISSTANSSNGSISYNGKTVDATTNNTINSLGNFVDMDIVTNSASFSLTAKNGGNLFNGSKTFNVWFLVPNDITETEIVGQQEVPDGLPYFALTTKLGNKSITSPDDLRATPEGFNILPINEITSSNQTNGLLLHNNPCVFKFSRISDTKLLSSGREIGPLTFINTEDDTTVWYLYKPNSAGFSTSSVTITYYLTHTETSNTSNSVTYGGSYTTTLSWDANKTPYKLQIMMCGHDITDAVYNESTKQINIPYVIGNIEILAAVVDAEDMKKVRYNLIDVASITDKTGYSESMSSDDFDAVLIGDKYTSKPSFEGLAQLSSFNFNIEIEPSKYKYMKISECYAEMEGERLDDIYNPNTNTITIPRITGDCLITVKALYIVGYVENNYYDLDKSDNHIFVESEALGSGSYNANFTKLGTSITSDYNNITSFTI